jgi:hypothetical protein
MIPFKETIENSIAVKRFMQVEGLTLDGMCELYLECFCSYRDMFMERIRYGAELRKIIDTYKDIPAFGMLKPSQLQPIIFNHPLIHYWFSLRFWKEIEKQVTTKMIDAGELQLQLTFMNQIPSREAMEGILNENRNYKSGESSSNGSKRKIAQAV